MPTEFPAADSTAIQLGVTDSLEPGAIQPMPLDDTSVGPPPGWDVGPDLPNPNSPIMIGASHPAQIIVFDPYQQQT
jgi:hypothetical protein